MNLDRINCNIDCVTGCQLGDLCPKNEYRVKASSFINETSLDRMLEIAEIARMKKLTAPPKWVMPDDF
jgi:uncharacterized protein (DUF4213/DUF364 family)